MRLELAIASNNPIPDERRALLPRTGYQSEREHLVLAMHCALVVSCQRAPLAIAIMMREPLRFRESDNAREGWHCTVRVSTKVVQGTAVKT